VEQHDLVLSLVTMPQRRTMATMLPRPGTLTFALGETTKTVTIEVKGDSKREANETFYLDLFDNSSNSLFHNNRGIGTILNDD
jgi:endoglucanase